MRFLVELLVAAMLVALFFVGLGFVIPSKATVERSLTIERPAIHVFDAVSSVQRIAEWGPWNAYEPNLRFDISGPAQGVGARASWSGADPRTGRGIQEVRAAETRRDDTGVRVVAGLVRLDMNLGQNRDGEGVIIIEPAQIGVKVTWRYDVEFGLNLVERYRGLYIDGEIGDELALGLTRLKAMLENTPYPADYSVSEIQMESLLARDALSTTGSVTSFEENVRPNPAPARAEALGKLQQFIQRNNLSTVGPPIYAINSKDLYNISFDIIQPVNRVDLRLPNDIVAVRTYEGRVVRARHQGFIDVFADSNQTLDRLHAYLAVRGLRAVDGQRPWVEMQSGLEVPASMAESVVYLPYETIAEARARAAAAAAAGQAPSN